MHCVGTAPSTTGGYLAYIHEVFGQVRDRAEEICPPVDRFITGKTTAEQNRECECYRARATFGVEPEDPFYLDYDVYHHCHCRKIGVRFKLGYWQAGSYDQATFQKHIREKEWQQDVGVYQGKIGEYDCASGSWDRQWW